MLLRFLFKRLLSGISVIFLVMTATFFLLRVMPGGPFDKEKKLPPEIIKNIEEKFHLDKPMHKQFLLYISGILRGNLGPSYKFLQRTTNDIIKDTFPVSFKLGLLSFAVSVLLGFILGTIAAVKDSKIFETFASLFLSIPSFVLASVLVFLLSVTLKLFPPALWEGTKYIVMPVITLSLSPIFYIAKITKTSVSVTLKEQFVIFAKAKGVYGLRLYFQLLKASLSGILGVLGIIFAFFITGSFIVETVFAIPGMGRYFVFAVTDRDYPVITGLTLVFTVILVLANIIADILQAVVDPRVRTKW